MTPANPAAARASTARHALERTARQMGRPCGMRTTDWRGIRTCAAHCPHENDSPPPRDRNEPVGAEPVERHPGAALLGRLDERDGRAPRESHHAQLRQDRVRRLDVGDDRSVLLHARDAPARPRLRRVGHARRDRVRQTGARRAHRPFRGALRPRCRSCANARVAARRCSSGSRPRSRMPRARSSRGCDERCTCARSGASPSRSQLQRRTESRQASDFTSSVSGVVAVETVANAV